MAEVIEALPPARGSLPWGVIFDGQAWLLRRGEDYDADERITAECVRGAGRRRGLIVRTRYSRADGTVKVQAVACQWPRVGFRPATDG